MSSVVGTPQDPKAVSSNARCLRIACVVSSLRGGGAELVMSRLAAALAERGHTVRVITFSGEDSDLHHLSSLVQRTALSCEGKSGNFSQRLGNMVRRVRALLSALRQSAPDVIISFTDTTNVYALLANQVLRIPIIVSERIDPRFHPVDRLTAGLRLGLYGTADGLVLQTHATCAWAKEVPRQPPTSVIPNPVCAVTADANSETAGFRPYVLAVGRLAAQKGFDTLIRAFALLVRSKSPDLRLVILGEGRERASLEGLCASLGVSGSVFLLGHQSTGPWLTDALMFVLSSRYEGFPNALGEAMAAGLPIVSTRCPSGPEEMLIDGESGLLVDVADPPALAAAMSRLADDPVLRTRLGKRARSEAQQHFAPTVIWDAWEAAISGAILHRRGSEHERIRP
jgi:glycosyltransferase involved in cell wall biosynthesis